MQTERAMDCLSEKDVSLAFRAFLGRPPESSETVRAFMDLGSPIRLAQAIARSEEFKQRTGLQFAEDHQIYRGYNPGDVAVFSEFPQHQGPGVAGFATNFLGVRFRTNFQAPLAPFSGVVEGYPLPVGGLQGETAEYIGALRSVLDAQDRYVMLECGAGYGPWMGLTAAAARARKITELKLYGIEGDLTHVEFMHQHMSDCNITRNQYEAIPGAVGAKNGKTSWAIVDDAAAVYGGRPLGANDIDYFGVHQDRVVILDMFAIADLLQREPIWDLVHIDIQGGEGSVCEAGIEEMTRRVRRVVVGTHSRALDGQVFTTFQSAAWHLENEKPTQMMWRPDAASPESLTLVDGIQVWKNPWLAQPR